jgi:arsenate reductase
LSSRKFVPPRKDLLSLKLMMNEDAFNVLFLCPDNATRSVMAEVLLNRLGGQRFHGFSAGLDPAEKVDPVAIELLESQNLPTRNVRSKSWREFCGPSAPRMHFVISLSDPTDKYGFPGTPMMACWHITDPRSNGPDETGRRKALRRAMVELETRIRLFVLLRHGTPEHSIHPGPTNPGTTAPSA